MHQPAEAWCICLIMSWENLSWMPNVRWLKRAIVAVVGSTALLVGIAMIVLPGPALLIIPIGLAILASEFVWAARLLHRFKLRRSPVPGSAPAAKKPTQKSET